MVFDRTAGYFQEYPVPDAEKPYTRDIRESSRQLREVTLDGVSFPAEKPLSVSAEAYPDPRTPFEALANFLHAGRAGVAADMIALHDEASRKLVGPALAEAGQNHLFFKTTKAILRVKVRMVFEAKGMTVIYGFNVFPDRENLHPWVFVREGGRYFKKAGAIELGFLQSLGGALQVEGTDALRLRPGTGR